MIQKIINQAKNKNRQIIKNYQKRKKTNRIKCLNLYNHQIKYHHNFHQYYLKVIKILYVIILIQIIEITIEI